MKIKKSRSDKFIDIFNIVFFSFFSLITLYPFWHELCLSLSDSAKAKMGGMFFYPRDFNAIAYKMVLTSRYIFIAFKNSMFIAIVGTFLSVLLCCGAAYFLSKKNLPGSKAFMLLLIFAMLFNGGLIPTYLVVNATGLYDKLWALIILACVSPYNIIIIRNFFQNLPAALEESALIDGAGPIRIFFQIILPLSKPVLATVSIWVAVGLWNNYMQGLIYLTDRKNYILPLLLRDIIIGASDLANIEASSMATSETVTAATIIIAIFPILCVYPFLQKHFTKGIMLGAVKG